MRGIDLKKIAEKMNGASGAELKAVEVGMFALERYPRGLRDGSGQGDGERHGEEYVSVQALKVKAHALFLKIVK